MGKSIEQVRQYFERARSMMELATKKAVERKRALQEEIRQVKADERLSGKGREEKIAEIKVKHGIEMLQEAYLLKQMYQAELRKARDGADAIVYAKPKKPDSVKLERFEDALKALKTELMLTTRTQDAKQKLDAFINQHIKGPEDRFFALRLRDEFQAIAESVLGAARTNREDVESLRARLREVYEALDTQTLSEAELEARQILEAAESSMDRSVYTQMVKDGMAEMLGRGVTKHLDNPEKFFEEHPEFKPADYVDPEIEKEKAEKARDDMWSRLDAILDEKIARGELNLKSQGASE